MQDARSTSAAVSEGCWPGPRPVREDLLGWIRRGRLAEARAAGRLPEALGALRRQSVARPTIFVGTGTCGLGAGAGKTLA
ncbi:MAG: hypothetical protein IMZ55_07325, partial [Acidobacteria bacterium]|nr:hypothetical protein [Acidobacteriota bacterium]